MKINYLYRLLVSSYGLSTFSEGIIMPIYAIFVQKIGGDILDAAGAIATFLIVCGVATIVIHRLEWSRKHRTALLVFGWLIWVIGIATYFLISNIFSLFAAQILVALGNAIADPVFDAELADHTDKKIKVYEYGVFEGMKDIFDGIAAIVGGIIASFFGWHVLIGFMVFTATGSFLMILYYVQARKKAALSA